MRLAALTLCRNVKPCSRPGVEGMVGRRQSPHLPIWRASSILRGWGFARVYSPPNPTSNSSYAGPCLVPVFLRLPITERGPVLGARCLAASALGPCSSESGVRCDLPLPQDQVSGPVRCPHSSSSQLRRSPDKSPEAISWRAWASLPALSIPALRVRSVK